MTEKEMMYRIKKIIINTMYVTVLYFSFQMITEGVKSIKRGKKL